MGTVFVDDKEVEVGPNQNLIQAAQLAGVEIPHYCWHPDLSVVASCRMCLVEVGERKPDGTESMIPKLVPACQTPAKPGTIVKTDTPKVKASQAQTLEFLLLNHPLDCSICDQAGECYLQDYTYKFGKASSRLDEPKVQRKDKYHIGDQIALFTDRCVMCTRCVRFTREISGTAELQVVSRGSVEEIDVFPDQPCNNKLAGNVVDLCPVGALCSKDFLYKKRVWWLKSQDSVCTGCSTGCSIEVDQNENRIYRLRPRPNPLAQGSFMCDEGRFGWKYVHSEDRLNSPRIGRASAIATSVAALSAVTGSSSGLGQDAMIGYNDLAYVDPWPDALSATRTMFRTAAASGRLMGIFSPMMTCEEAYLLARFLRGIDKQAVLALGPVPLIGEDDLYPKDHRGNPPERSKARFIIRNEKCPNRLGVTEVLRGFGSRLLDFSSVPELIANESISAAFVVGGYVGGWPDSVFVERLPEKLKLAVLDLLPSALTDRADVLLAGGSFAEREGTVINHAGLAQSLRTAMRPIGESRPDGRILYELNDRKGLFHARSVREEWSRELPRLAALADKPIPDQGLKLPLGEAMTGAVS